ncbi:MAG: DNA pilot protein [Microviridae sp.]|nr:MAG: DNA pilot protein [Microviridae sp.]
MGFFSSIGNLITGGIKGFATTGSPWGALAGAGLSYLGSMQTNSANAEQAQMNRDFQERMSNTSYQRGVADMRAAGLNPALSYSNGGASTPAGDKAVMQNNIGSGVSSAMQALQLSTSIDNMREDTRLKAAQAIAARAQAANSAADAAKKSPGAGIYGAIGNVINPLTDQVSRNANSAKVHWSIRDRIRGFHVRD